MNPLLSLKITNANVLLTLLIVMLHTTWQAAPLTPVRMVADAAVPCFFTISSFLYFRKWNERPSLTLFYRHAVLSRVRSLLVPYLLYNTIYYFYYILKIHVLGMATDKVIPTNAAGALWCILQSTPDGVLWYLRELFAFALCGPLLAWAIGKSRLATPIIMLGGVWVASVCPYETMPHWLPCLALGCHCALYPDRAGRLLKALRRLPWHATWPPVMAVVAVCGVMFYGEQRHGFTLPYYLWRMATPLCLVLLYNHRLLLPRRVAAWLEPYTFFIFCNHFVCLHITYSVIPRLDPWPCLALRYAAALALTLTLATLAGMAVRRIKPLWRVLNGGRS